MKSALALLLLVSTAHAAALPGFHIQKLGAANGFPDSIAVDSHNTIYYTTTDGSLFRFSNGASALVTRVNTTAIGDSGLLGMALLNDDVAAVHYTTPAVTADVISTIDLHTGAETVLHSFPCDIDLPGRTCAPEHHGGNPTVGSDGSIFFGIGDYGGRAIAALPQWNGGKIWRVMPDGSVEQFARGFRNPFDMSWDAANQRLIVGDNGDLADDEINIVHLGDFCGWPYTMGDQPPIEGAVPPAYVFPVVVAPTGLVAVNGHNGYFPSGYLMSAFVAQALYYVPTVDANPFPDPIQIITAPTPMIDVSQGPDGTIYFVAADGVYQLIAPARGDCNGDGRVDASDLAALAQELLDGNPEATSNAQNGAYPGSWGCDANADGVIDSRDMTALQEIVRGRVRVVRRW